MTRTFIVGSEVECVEWGRALTHNTATLAGGFQQSFFIVPLYLCRRVDVTLSLWMRSLKVCQTLLKEFNGMLKFNGYFRPRSCSTGIHRTVIVTDL